MGVSELTSQSQGQADTNDNSRQMHLGHPCGTLDVTLET